MNVNQDKKKIEIDEKSIRHLKKIRKWTMFLSVVGFILLFIFIIMGLLTGTFLSTFSSGDDISNISDISFLLAFFFVAIASFFPINFLFHFSANLTRAIELSDSGLIEKGFRNLKRFFVSMGIIILFILSLYIATFIIAGTSMAFMRGL